MRESWREDTAYVFLSVAPSRRRHVVGTRGNTIRQLQEYPAVSVTLPLSQDPESRHVALDGYKSQVAAAKQNIIAHLETI